jgi:acyl carrier protein
MALRAEAVIRETIERLVTQRSPGPIEILPGSKLTEDLGLDSLELAELSAVLEDTFDRDPFSEGIVPGTVAELVSYYDR